MAEKNRVFIQWVNDKNTWGDPTDQRFIVEEYSQINNKESAPTFTQSDIDSYISSIKMTADLWGTAALLVSPVLLATAALATLIFTHPFGPVVAITVFFASTIVNVLAVIGLIAQWIFKNKEAEIKNKTLCNLLKDKKPDLHSKKTSVKKELTASPESPRRMDPFWYEDPEPSTPPQSPNEISNLPKTRFFLTAPASPKSPVRMDPFWNEDPAPSAPPQSPRGPNNA